MSIFLVIIRNFKIWKRIPSGVLSKLRMLRAATTAPSQLRVLKDSFSVEVWACVWAGGGGRGGGMRMRWGGGVVVVVHGSYLSTDP